MPTILELPVNYTVYTGTDTYIYTQYNNTAIRSSLES